MRLSHIPPVIKTAMTPILRFLDSPVCCTAAIGKINIYISIAKPAHASPTVAFNAFSIPGPVAAFCHDCPGPGVVTTSVKIITPV